MIISKLFYGCMAGDLQHVWLVDLIALEVMILMSGPGAEFVRDSAEISVLFTKVQVETQKCCFL